MTFSPSLLLVLLRTMGRQPLIEEWSLPGLGIITMLRPFQGGGAGSGVSVLKAMSLMMARPSGVSFRILRRR